MAQPIRRCMFTLKKGGDGGADQRARRSRAKDLQAELPLRMSCYNAAQWDQAIAAYRRFWPRRRRSA